MRRFHPNSSGVDAAGSNFMGNLGLAEKDCR